MIDTNKFLDYEEKHELFNKEVDGINYWQLIRGQVYEKYLNYMLDIKTRHPDLEMNASFEGGYKKAIKLFWNSIIHPSKYKYSRDKIVFITWRRQKNCAVEVLCSQLPNDTFLIDRPYKFSHLTVNSNIHWCTSDYIELIRGISILVEQHDRRLIKNIRDSVNEWFDDLVNNFNIELDFNWVINRVIYVITTQKVLRKYYTKIFTKYRPRKLVIYPHYEEFSFAIIYVAHKLGIKVFELQHGFVSKTHIAYNYKEYHYEYLPDYYLLYGEYWKDIITFPKKESMICCGSIETDSLKTNSCKSCKENSIIIISQAPYADVLYPFAVKLKNAIYSNGYNWKVIYKLHPSEVTTWNSLHPTFKDDDIVFETKNVYDVFEECSIQIGVDSTALFEGLAYGLKTYIIDCKYLETSNMEDLCKMGLAKLVGDPMEIVHEIEQTMNASEENTEKDINYIWKDHALANIQNCLLDELI